MKASIGRIVHFVDRHEDIAYPAIITGFDLNDDPFLTVFYPHRGPWVSPPMRHESDVRDVARWFWRWPPRVE